MNNYLKNKNCYISGPIENGCDQIDWRKELTDKIQEFELNIFNPLLDPKQQYSEALYKARDNKDYDEISRITKGFVKKDLTMVDKCDILIAYLPYKIATYGTIEEIVTAARSKKPCLLFNDKGKEYIPLWFYGYIPHEQMFGNINDLYNYLKEVNEEKHKDNNKWNYIYGLI